MPSPKMNPRSSTGMYAFSIGMNSPFRYTISLIGDPSFEEQPQAVPTAAEDAGDRDLFQGYHREFAVRLAVHLDAQHADLLARGDRREQRLPGFDRRLELLRVTFRDAHEKIVLEARLDLVRPAFPDLDRGDGLVLLVEPHGVEELEAVIQELLAFGGARRFRAGAHHDRNQAPRPAARRRDQAVAGRLGVAGLDAVNRRIDPQQ